VSCQLVGWLVDGRGPLAFHWDSAGHVWAGREEYVIGSGAEDFKANAARRDVFYSDDVALTPDEQVTQIALILAGDAIGREMLSGEPLRHGYGGGMEVAVFAGGRFTVISDVCFLFWQAEMDVEEIDFRLAPVPTILKYLHVNDCLVVHTSRIERGEAVAQEVHVVTPVDREVEVSDFFPRFLSGQSAHYCNCFGGRVTGYGSVTGTMVMREPNRFIRFGQDVRDGKLEAEWLEVHSDFPALVYETLKTALNNQRGPASP